MKRLVLIAAVLMMLMGSVPSFADGNPPPHGPVSSGTITR
jgi:hypothetical protein